MRISQRLYLNKQGEIMLGKFTTRDTRKNLKPFKPNRDGLYAITGINKEGIYRTINRGGDDIAEYYATWHWDIDNIKPVAYG
jgi:hypothetical protein